ncbi:MAG: DUF4040 family protein [Corynebacterium sp.]|nr:DUF4040 family protein [Corynebacterium sp.]
MNIFIALVLAAATVACAPIFVRFLDRNAGWPLAAMFVIAAGFISADLGSIWDGQPETWSVTWIPDLMDVQFALKADALSAFFALLALGIGAVVFIYSAAYLPKKRGNTSFYTIMTAFTTAILLLVLADDVFLLFVGWELVSLASFMLIARSGGHGGEMGSQRTLILTFVGGLSLIAALAVASIQAGSTNLTTILAADFWGEKPGITTTLAVLIALAAFTKSAQLPFHFWLPEAMAAATPVSAFLHAAAVVKAGIYLLIRFSAVFAENTTWNLLLIIIGMSTAVMASFFAIQKTDLKKLTAYSTVSHLGWIVATIGIGTPFALAAALVHTLAHALFKSSLFMLIGVIDHQTGTRETTRLGSSWRQMPWTFASVVIAATSMAAVPPMLGFVSKEGMLEAFLDAPLSTFGVVLLLIAAGIGAIFTFTYSARIIFDGFIDGERDMSEVKEAPIRLWLPAALPAVLALPLVAVVGILDKPIDAAVATVHTSPEIHLAIWHGFTLPLAISVIALIVGCIGICYRKQIWAAVNERKFAPRSGNELLKDLIQFASACGRLFAKLADSLSPTRHLAYVFGALVALASVVTFNSLMNGGIDGVALDPRLAGTDRLADLLPLAIIAVSLIGLTRTRKRLTAVILLGAIGVGVTLQMLMLGAPDVALTQFMVEALVVVIMCMVVRQQPDLFHPTSNKRKGLAAVLAVLVGLATFLTVWFLFSRRERSDLALYYLQEGPEITGGHNVVNTILVEFRAFDTLGELSVLGMAAVVIAAVVGSMPRYPFQKGTHPAPFGLSRVNAIPLQQMTKVLIVVLGIISFIVFMRGHNNPGGGFIAALIAGGALMLSYFSYARDRRIFGINTPARLTQIGILTAVAAGFIGLLRGSFLYAIHGHFAGQHWTTSIIFDIGVYLAVLGMLSMAINVLGGYLRPGLEPKELNFGRSASPLANLSEIPSSDDDDIDWPQPYSHRASAKNAALAAEQEHNA